MSEPQKDMIEEEIDVLLESKNKLRDWQEVVDKITTLQTQNTNYLKFGLKVVEDARTKELQVIFMGLREETDEEAQRRIAAKEIKRKQIDAAELKEYLRLKRKYGKK